MQCNFWSEVSCPEPDAGTSAAMMEHPAMQEAVANSRKSRGRSCSQLDEELDAGARVVAAQEAAAAMLKSPPPPEQQLRQTLSRQISRERVRSDTSAENLVQSAVA